MGGNNRGQLGDGTTTDRSTPVQVATDAASVSAGGEHTLFIKTNGSLWAMGSNVSGQLGDGSNLDRSSPVQVTSNIASVSAGRAHTMLVTKSGVLWAMGLNDSGQLGDGTTSKRSAPVPVASGVASVAAGTSHTMFVKTDGTLWAMGANTHGELGDGTTTSRTVPVPVASGVVSVVASTDDTIFVKADGTIWTMGANNYGELGGDPATIRLTPVQVTNSLAIVAQPSSQSAVVDQTVTLTVGATGTPRLYSSQPSIYQWQFNGSAMTPGNLNYWSIGPVIPVTTTSALKLAYVQPENAGLYSATILGGVATSDIAILGLTSTAKVIGAGTEIAHDIYVAANGNTFDQVLLQGSAAAITADYALKQITRMSFIDLSNDIVQVELSGPGTLSLVLDNPSGPAAAANYNQPTVAYMKGHAGIVITGATEDTNLSVFSVGRITAVNQGLFKSGVTYDGVADLAFIAIISSNGKFGGLRTANASYFATKGLTGIYAPGVAFTGPVFIGDISATDTATPVIVIGSSPDTRITGGDLLQANGEPIVVAGLTRLKFAAGADSHGNPLSAKTNRAVLRENGIDVTNEVTVNP